MTHCRVQVSARRAFYGGGTVTTAEVGREELHSEVRANMAQEDFLFSTEEAFAVQEHQRRAAEAEIADMDGNRLLNTNVDNLVAYIVERYRIDVPELDEANMSVDQRESQRDVSGDPQRMAYFINRGPVHIVGTEVIVEVPFSGDPKMFNVRPSTYDTLPPRGELQRSTIKFRYWSDTPQAGQVRSELDRWLADVKRYLQWLRDSFKGFNDALAGSTQTAITRRREKLLANLSLVAELGIPLKRRPGTTATYTAPEVKRKIAPKMPPATPGAFKPEPILEEAEYQHILDVIEDMERVMERSPKAFHDIDEEALRTLFLVPLNSHYEGQATGETFNYEGKTDILIRSGDRNIFIAECKFWNGPATLTKTIDQLLGYLSWRDSKAAILLFNRNKDFSRVLGAIPEIVKTHPNFQRDEGKRGETGFRYAFRHKDDPAKILHLTVMAFDVPRQSP